MLETSPEKRYKPAVLQRQEKLYSL